MDALAAAHAACEAEWQQRLECAGARVHEMQEHLHTLQHTLQESQQVAQAYRDEVEVLQKALEKALLGEAPALKESVAQIDSVEGALQGEGTAERNPDKPYTDGGTMLEHVALETMQRYLCGASIAVAGIAHNNHHTRKHRRLRLEQVQHTRAQSTMSQLQEQLTAAQRAQVQQERRHAALAKEHKATKARAAAMQQALQECQAQLEACKAQTTQRGQQLKAAKAEQSRLSRALSDARAAAPPADNGQQLKEHVCPRCVQLQQRLQASAHAGRARAAAVQRLREEVQAACKAREELQRQAEVLQGQLTRCKAMHRGREEALERQVRDGTRYEIVSTHGTHGITRRAVSQCIGSAATCDSRVEAACTRQ